MTEDPTPRAEVAIAEEPAAMSFWEHLDELRRRIIWSVIAFTVGWAIAWEIREKLLWFFSKPFEHAWHVQQIAGPPTLHSPSPQALFIAYINLSMLGGAALSAPVI